MNRLEYPIRTISGGFPINEYLYLTRYEDKQELVNIKTGEVILASAYIHVVFTGKLLATFHTTKAFSQILERSEAKYVITVRYPFDSQIYTVNRDEINILYQFPNFAQSIYTIDSDRIIYHYWGENHIYNLATTKQVTYNSIYQMVPISNNKLAAISNKGDDMVVNIYDTDFNKERSISFDVASKYHTMLITDSLNEYFIAHYSTETDIATVYLTDDSKATKIKTYVNAWGIRYIKNYLVVLGRETNYYIDTELRKEVKTTPYIFSPCVLPLTTRFARDEPYTGFIINDRVIRTKSFSDPLFITSEDKMMMLCSCRVFLRDYITRDVINMIFSCIDIL